MKSTIFVILILVTILTHCGNSGSKSSLIGNYELRGHDYSGRLIFTGVLSLTSLKNNGLEGTCKVIKVAQDFEGAVNKDGVCEGKLSGDEVTLYLAPTLSDGGVVFVGHSSKNRISGTWQIESMAGSKVLGTFEAKRK